MSSHQTRRNHLDSHGGIFLTPRASQARRAAHRSDQPKRTGQPPGTGTDQPPPPRTHPPPARPSSPLATSTGSRPHRGRTPGPPTSSAARQSAQTRGHGVADLVACRSVDACARDWSEQLPCTAAQKMVWRVFKNHADFHSATINSLDPKLRIRHRPWRQTDLFRLRSTYATTSNIAALGTHVMNFINVVDASNASRISDRN
jgi:hypothetical protein